MCEHKVNVTRRYSTSNTCAHMDAVVSCSCGWEERISYVPIHSPEVDRAILYHRVASLEEAVGVKFELTFGIER